VHEPTRGVSSARNAGLSQAVGDFVAFIDDDEVATEYWLAHLLDTQARFAADVVFGPVEPILPDIADSRLSAFFESVFTYSADRPSGTEIISSILVPFWARGRNACPPLNTANCLIFRKAEEVAKVQFDDRLGRFGGEDALYFIQLCLRGARLVWCAEAVVSEYIPEERVRLGYVLARSFRGGQMVSWAPMLLSPPRPALTALSIGIALAQVLTFTFMALGAAVVGSPKRYSYLARLVAAIGKLFWGARFRRNPWPSWRDSEGE
jgi:glycosyltransferase involved in cell wall biosynthesis